MEPLPFMGEIRVADWFEITSRPIVSKTQAMLFPLLHEVEHPQVVCWALKSPKTIKLLLIC